MIQLLPFSLFSPFLFAHFIHFSTSRTLKFAHFACPLLPRSVFATRFQLEMEPSSTEEPQTEQFHHFRRLPPELREAIWLMAIRLDKTPRIHYFSLLNDSEDETQSLLRQMATYQPPRLIHPNLPLGRLRRSPRLRPPIPPEPRWAKANHFSDIWDAGLYTACNESRKVVLRHLERTPPPPRSTLARTNHQGEDVYIRVDPESEIFCLKFSPHDVEACKDLLGEDLLSRLPFFYTPKDAACNIAFEFDLTWMDNLPLDVEKLLPEGSERGLVVRLLYAWMTGELHPKTSIWLIDRAQKMPDWEYTVLKGHGRQTFVDGQEIYAHALGPQCLAMTQTKIDRFIARLLLWGLSAELERPQRYARSGCQPFMSTVSSVDHCFKVLRPVAGMGEKNSSEQSPRSPWVSQVGRARSRI